MRRVSCPGTAKLTAIRQMGAELGPRSRDSRALLPRDLEGRGIVRMGGRRGTMIAEPETDVDRAARVFAAGVATRRLGRRRALEIIESALADAAPTGS